MWRVKWMEGRLCWRRREGRRECWEAVAAGWYRSCCERHGCDSGCLQPS